MKTAYNHNNLNSIKNNGQTRFPIVLSSLAIALLLVSGCSPQSSEYDQEQSSSDMDYTVSEQAAVDMNATPEELPASQSQPSTKLSIGNIAGDSEQKLGSQVTDIEIVGKTLLISAQANFKVKDVVKSSSAIETLTRQQGGYVALSNITNVENDSRTFNKGTENITLTTYYRQADMTVRIPKAKVSEFLRQVQQQVAFLNEQTFSAQDVTLDIYREQLATQLNSDMASELSQERLASNNAKNQESNINSITATYNARQQQQYAQLQQLDIADKVKYSTIELSFTQPASSYKEVTQNLDILIDAERPSFGAQINEAFKQGWEMLRTVTITLIQLWWLLLLGGVFYLIYRSIKVIYRQLFKRKEQRITPKRQQLLKKELNDDINDSHS
jgi:hypothetical protein